MHYRAAARRASVDQHTAWLGFVLRQIPLQRRVRRLRRHCVLLLADIRGLIYTFGLLPGYAGIALINCAAWGWVTRLLSGHDALMSALVGVAMIVLTLPAEVVRPDGGASVLVAPVPCV